MGSTHRFRAAVLAGFTALAFLSPPARAEGAKSITLTPQVFPVGKWAEGVAVTPEGVWVAESGQRSIALLDEKTGKVLRRVKVGRLPVNMVTDEKGVVSTLVQTDRRIWRQPAKGEGKGLNGLPGCPNGLAQGQPALWVLTLPTCDSTKSLVVRIDPANGAKAQTRLLREWGQALAYGRDRVYVAHARPPALDIVDAKTLDARTTDLPGLSLWSITASGGRVFAGGRIIDNWAQGVVVSLDPQTGAEQRRQMVDQNVMAIVADAENVAAIGREGRIFVFRADTLEPVSVIDLSTGPFHASDATIASGRLYVTSQSQFGEDGAVLVVEGWRAAR
jgi:outer membrane protein assembly factor BamB